MHYFYRNIAQNNSKEYFKNISINFVLKYFVLKKSSRMEISCGWETMCCCCCESKLCCEQFLAGKRGKVAGENRQLSMNFERVWMWK